MDEAGRMKWKDEYPYYVDSDISSNFRIVKYFVAFRSLRLSAATFILNFSDIRSFIRCLQNVKMV